jgi:hypothetical protein
VSGTLDLGPQVLSTWSKACMMRSACGAISFSSLCTIA